MASPQSRSKSSRKSSRIERKLQAEARRREQQRRERRASIIIYSSGAILAIIILLLAFAPSQLKSYHRSQQRKVGYVASPSKAAKAANCTGVHNDPQLSRDNATAVDYLTLLRNRKLEAPPSSGPNDPNALPDTPPFYQRTDKPSAERAVHNLANGFIVAWYDAQLPDAEVAKLRDFATDAGGRFIAVPWDRSTFPDGRHVVLTAWDRTQRCGTVSPEVVHAFQTKYADPATGKDWKSPTAPQAGGAGGIATPTLAPPPAKTTPKPSGKPSATAPPKP